MNPALIREREAFLKRSAATPSVQATKARKVDSPTPPVSSKQSKGFSTPSPSASRLTLDTYKQATATSQYKFSVLANIVKYMMRRHLEGDTHPLSVDEIIEETNQTDVSQRIRNWLAAEALPNNEKLTLVEGNKFVFCPKYKVTGRKGLLRLLEKNDQNGLGGVMVDDLSESIANVDRCIRQLADSVTVVTRLDKKRVLFFNDKSLRMTIDDEFQQMWRSVSVDGIDERQIEEYLKNQGIASMQDLNMKKRPVILNKKRGMRKPRAVKTKDNEHMTDILQDFSEVTPVSK